MNYNPNNYDYTVITRKIEKFIFQKINESDSTGIVIGLSGGIDSSVCLALSAKSISNHNILGLILPMKGITPEEDEQDAINLAEQFKIDYRIITLNDIYNSYMKELTDNKIAQGNLLARMRMSLIYYHANLLNRIVIGTGDKSEFMLGYFTKYGDGGVDIAPIGDLFKTQIRILAKKLDVPNNIIKKKSSPRLWKDHDAEDELEMTYDEVDKLLYMIDNNSIKENNLSTQDSTIIKKIKNRQKINYHKLKMPDICKID